MGEPTNTVTVEGQYIGYALQLCETINNTLTAAGSHQRYQQTSRELVNSLQLIRNNSYLQTPETTSCIRELISTADNICSALSQRKGNRLMLSIAFIIKRKSLRNLFANLERQKAALLLHISQLNENTPAHQLQHSNTLISDLEGNVQISNTLQIVGMEIGPNARVTDTELIRATSGLTARNNIHAGNGTQVIGQRVRAGAKPQIFSGQYCNNVNQNDGEQVIGFSIE
ncbi:hypothetical protein F5X98DRAFT_349857 [Xylaria grammica]|nr:hypothetical protein F5X98DRAFT_349857 [Xylaria grammica]